MYFAFGYGLYFYFTWLPTYLIRELGFSLLAGGLFAALPFLLAGIADLVGGWLTDWLARTRGLRVGRCGLGFARFSRARALLSRRRCRRQPVAKAVLLALALGVGRPRARRVLGGAASTSAPITPASSPAS